MSALDDVLGHLSPEKRADYARIVGRYGIDESAAEVVSVALIIEAVSPFVSDLIAATVAEREKIERAAESLPEAMRAAGAEIATSIGAEIGKGAGTALVTSLKGAMDAHLATLRSERAAEREADQRAVQAVVREAAATHQVTRAAIDEVQRAGANACRDVTRYASDIGQRVSTLTEHARRTLFAVVASVLIGTVGAGTLGWFIERQIDHASTYAHGWQDGAAAARSHMHRAGES